MTPDVTTRLVSSKGTPSNMLSSRVVILAVDRSGPRSSMIGLQDVHVIGGGGHFLELRDHFLLSAKSRFVLFRLVAVVVVFLAIDMFISALIK